LIAAASENSELFNTLRMQLRLTDEQCRQLQSIAHHTREETRKLDAIAKCFSALRVHDWLYFPGIEVRCFGYSLSASESLYLTACFWLTFLQSLLHHTRNTMTSQQFQRFLTWTAENGDVIEQLPTMASASGNDGDGHLEFAFSED
jgi:hypothetical protein